MTPITPLEAKRFDDAQITIVGPEYDGGKRTLVAVCYKQEHADMIVRDVNTHEALVEALCACRAVLCACAAMSGGPPKPPQRDDPAWQQLQPAIDHALRALANSTVLVAKGDPE